MQPVRDAAPIFILDLHQVSGKRAQDLFLPLQAAEIRND